MPRNSSGTYSLPEAPFVAGTVISSSAMNSDLSDIADALTGSLARNGAGGMTGQFAAIDGSTSAPSISFNNDTETGFYLAGAGEIGVVISGVSIGLFASGGWSGSVSDGCPIGTIVDYAGTAAPTRWLLLYGQNVNRITYADLFAVVGTTYGSGDGVNTFGLPDCRGAATFGRADMGGSATTRLTSTYYGTNPSVLGNLGGVESKALLTANLPAYTPAGTIVTNSTINANSGFNQPTGAPNVVGVGGTASGGQLVTGLAVTSTSTFTGTAQGGVSTAFAVVSPGIILNKIIFAGV